MEAKGQEKKKIVRNRGPQVEHHPERITLTTGEAAEAMGISKYLVEGAIRRGELRVSKLAPRIYRLLPAELEAWAIRTLSSQGESVVIPRQENLPEEVEDTYSSRGDPEGDLDIPFIEKS